MMKKNSDEQKYSIIYFIYPNSKVISILYSIYDFIQFKTQPHFFEYITQLFNEEVALRLRSLRTKQ